MITPFFLVQILASVRGFYVAAELKLDYRIITTFSNCGEFIIELVPRFLDFSQFQ